MSASSRESCKDPEDDVEMDGSAIGRGSGSWFVEGEFGINCGWLKRTWTLGVRVHFLRSIERFFFYILQNAFCNFSSLSSATVNLSCSCKG